MEFKNTSYEEIGREQFFRHYPKSKLPIRDVRFKTEPHIEIGAENYLKSCLQRNIRGFINNNEKYLFLCTTCSNRELEDYFGKRFIVGYIEKNLSKNLYGRMVIFGETYMVPFDTQLEYGALRINRSRGMQRFNRDDTHRILQLILSHEDIRDKCIKEMILMEDLERNMGKVIPDIFDKCLYLKGCEYSRSCLRRKII